MDREICPLCRESRFSPWRAELLGCEACGLRVDASLWNVLANEQLEEEWFGDDYDPERSPWVRWFEAWNNRRTLRRIAVLELTGRRLIEIGVGSGSFLRLARDRGFQVSGCDLSKEVCRLVERRTGVPVHFGHLASMAEADRFDLAVMNHVLEHSDDPVGLLRDIGNRLVPGGALHLAVPNAACWEARLPGWASYEPYHLVFFTPTTLTHCVREAGLEVEFLATHESFSGWFLAVLRTLLGVHTKQAAERVAARVNRTESLGEHIYRALMVTVGGVSWPLRALQARMGKGDELVLIARKPHEA